VVHMPQVLDKTWIDLIDLGVQRNLKGPGPYSARFFEGTEREFYHDFCNYAAIPEYQMLLRESPFAETVAEILGTKNLWLFFDQIFIKDGGLTKRTPWHQDLTYFCTSGTQIAACWITLDELPASESLEFVRGSHHGTVYAGADFGQPASDEDEVYPALPDIEADRSAFDITSFDNDPGDVVMFHPGLLHGGASMELGRSRRTLSLRFYGDDVVYASRPVLSPPYPGLSAMCEVGAPLRSSWFPQVVPKPVAPPW
jgi:ectoine hydroxylase-related dioxygenase (phytanoyl-CoA dioxygenase family)